MKWKNPTNVGGEGKRGKSEKEVFPALPPPSGVFVSDKGGAQIK